MKIRIDFGLNGFRELVSWWGALLEFPKSLDYKGAKWEWVLYDEDKTKQVDYIFTFTQMSSFSYGYSIPCVKFEDLLKNSYGNKCECGAVYTSFPQFHMFYCSKHKGWDFI